MNQREKQILAVRNHILKDRKVLCTGNPDRYGTIASGIKTVWPETTFIHLSNGFDFNDIDAKPEKYSSLFRNHNTFINASYVNGIQVKLLKLCQKHMPVGDVFNIGSTHEYDGLGTEEYKQNKLELREISLALNTFRFQTCHVVLGGIDTGKKTTAEWMKPKKIAEILKWITLQESYKIPIIGIDQPKKPF